jgi:UPF0716 protein FxsA
MRTKSPRQWYSSFEIVGRVEANDCTLGHLAAAVLGDEVSMRFLSIIAIFALPILDLAVTRQFAQASSISIWVLLLGAALAGVLLIRAEGMAFRARFMAALTSATAHEPNPWRSVVMSGKKVAAGFLLLLPGILSDVAALALFLVPLNVASRLLPAWATSLSRQPTAGPARRESGVIDGTYRRVE